VPTSWVRLRRRRPDGAAGQRAEFTVDEQSRCGDRVQPVLQHCDVPASRALPRRVAGIGQSRKFPRGLPSRRCGVLLDLLPKVIPRELGPDVPVGTHTGGDPHAVVIGDPRFTLPGLLGADHQSLQSVAAGVADRDVGRDVDAMLHLVEPSLPCPTPERSRERQVDRLRIARLQNGIGVLIGVDDVVHVPVVVDGVVVGDLFGIVGQKTGEVARGAAVAVLGVQHEP
jgi:hypothetical protein